MLALLPQLGWEVNQWLDMTTQFNRRMADRFQAWRTTFSKATPSFWTSLLKQSLPASSNDVPRFADTS